MKKSFTQKERRVLSEIYRRLNYFHEGNLDAHLLLLELPSVVKCLDSFGLVKPSTREIKHYRNWYNLTDKGKKFFANYVTNTKLSEQMNHDLFTGRYVKHFDFELLSNL